MELERKAAMDNCQKDIQASTLHLSVKQTSNGIQVILRILHLVSQQEQYDLFCKWHQYCALMDKPALNEPYTYCHTCILNRSSQGYKIYRQCVSLLTPYSRGFSDQRWWSEQTHTHTRSCTLSHTLARSRPCGSNYTHGESRAQCHLKHRGRFTFILWCSALRLVLAR